MEQAIVANATDGAERRSSRRSAALAAVLPPVKEGLLFLTDGLTRRRPLSASACPPTTRAQDRRDRSGESRPSRPDRDDALTTLAARPVRDIHKIAENAGCIVLPMLGQTAPIMKS